MKTKISKVMIQEGPLYEMMGEDSPIVIYDVFVIALAGDIIYRHEHNFEGHFYDRDGIARPNMSQRSKVIQFADRVKSAGEINLKYWTEIARIPGGKKHDKYEKVDSTFFIN